MSASYLAHERPTINVSFWYSHTGCCYVTMLLLFRDITPLIFNLLSCKLKIATCRRDRRIGGHSYNLPQVVTVSICGFNNSQPEHRDSTVYHGIF